jgi:hypothetical protein
LSGGLPGTLTKHWKTGDFQIDALDIQEWLKTLVSGEQVSDEDLAVVASAMGPGLLQNYNELAEYRRQAMIRNSSLMLVWNTNYYMKLSVVQRLRLTVLSGLLAP